MIILFGIRRLKKNMGSIFLRCTNCGMSPLTLIRVSTWFALFFIPVIPLRFRHYTSCPNCKRFEGVAKADVERAQAQQEALRRSGTEGPGAPMVPATLESAVNTWASEGQGLDGVQATPGGVAAPDRQYRPPRPAAGWYADPDGSGGQRYWDGQQWTAHTARPT